MVSSAVWFREVKDGDMLKPKPLWNQTEREANHLAVPTKIIRTLKGSSESGVLFEVRTKGGPVRLLDSGWFEPPAAVS